MGAERQYNQNDSRHMRTIIFNHTK